MRENMLLYLNVVPDGPAEDRFLLLVLLHASVDEAVGQPELVIKQDGDVGVKVGHDAEALVVPAELLHQQLPPRLLLALNVFNHLRFSQGTLQKQFCLRVHLKL